MIETGQRVQIRGHITKDRPLYIREVSLRKIEYKEPKEALVLGKSKRFTGMVQGDWEGSYLQVTESHDVWIVMPVDKHNRYREAIAVLEEQMVLE